MNPYVPLLIMIAVASLVAVGGLAVSAILGPKRYNRVKVANYECGLEPTPSAGASGRFPIKYFLTAMTFIIFDIEVVFLYPWAVSAGRLGLASLIAIASFVFLITIPFIYEWRRGGLDWE
ncbi:NADH-quinone oxidoreductase subunit A [Arcanobacterium haemolyticum]|uniref:NADH-quinone oxidoreductase subunit A n=1 Tax=Arcanobacterium haemolyticum (strain ATCC 9345 / DSM 20595 / CCM 5947 / CCUG 17215 / LMG 16163 / NBRC 15585 / NCTC 8452 / 11018) TaxID=644284 RepID=D7BMA2_ARCHD|nr:NADH-quinone oxidoreductase subunit A [Arcanobacterium haemolyticum]ADH92051.1 NADH-ubiquinone/plastoquinone oxidoreductase chain 3 [Arcanobacterium haemolyticum DSM 20595]QCX46224.1 NADH-quinone oxidoreductase subunit A [Arcanobacterium haemolyticum]SPT74935.1 NAD(P)H-quinone oxidoreductase subunit 3 [Arcanobacterium haemolyticum]SQH29245.1 NAD(P)H-quinone oxidoreductase subunit 3 [Arcanobacterium haemolyticum]